jgi:replicative DNA helicase
MDENKNFTKKFTKKKPAFSEHGKVQPQATNLEEAVLGALMLDKDAVALIIDILRPASFYKEAHQHIYKAICILFEKSHPIDLLTVTEELKKLGKLEMVGGPYQLVELTNRVASSANIEFHARIIAQKFIQRELIRSSTETITAAYEDTVDVFDLLDSAEQNLFNITEQNLSRGSLGMSTLVNMAVKQLEEMSGKEEGLTGVPTGFVGLDQLTSGWQPSDLIIIAARPGMGKCLGKGTKVLKYDGNLEKVENIQVGDLLMGDDSTPRKVASIARGQERMYWIHQNEGISYRVNESHILSLKCSRNEGEHTKGDVLNISVKDWLTKSTKFKSNYKGYKVPVEFKEQSTLLAPYFIGLWLGDGSSAKPEIYTQDPEVVAYIHEFAEHQDLQVRPYLAPEKCPAYAMVGGSREHRGYSLMDDLRALNLINNKHIPQEYLINSRSNRLALLAGLLDSHGHYLVQSNGYEITQKNKHLAEQIKFLCDSLGFRTSFKAKKASIASIVYRVRIYGNIDAIPVKINYKAAKPWKSVADWQVTEITVEEDIVDDYYGFTIDGNNLFLLEDMTVTHNTAFTMAVARNAAIEFNKGVAFFSLEMSSLQLVNRLISMETEIPSEKLRKGQLEDYEWQQLHAQVDKLSNVPLFIDDTPGISIFELRAKCRRLKMQHDIQMVVVDYLQLMTGGGDNKGNREQEISMISRGLKGLAKELSVPVIALSQLSRAVETRGGSKRPQLSDLRESGAIEQDADIVSFIYRPEYYQILEDEEGNSLKGIGEIIVAKHRNGALDSVRLKWDGQFAKFSNLDDDAFTGIDDSSFFDQANNELSGETFSSKINKTNENDNGIDDVPF